MAFSKSHLYPIELQERAMFAKALCHPERLAIMSRLCKKGPCTVGQLCENSPLTLSVVSQHLRILRTSGLIEFEERPPNILYLANEMVVDRARSCLQSQFNLWL